MFICTVTFFIIDAPIMNFAPAQSTDCLIFPWPERNIILRWSQNFWTKPLFVKWFHFSFNKVIYRVRYLGTSCLSISFNCRQSIHLQVIESFRFSHHEKLHHRSFFTKKYFKKFSTVFRAFNSYDWASLSFRLCMNFWFIPIWRLAMPAVDSPEMSKFIWMCARKPTKSFSMRTCWT